MQTIVKKHPRFWRSWSSGEGKYEIGVDSEVESPNRNGHSAFVQSLDTVPGDWGGLVQTFGGHSHRGKRIRFSARLKTRDVEGEAALFMLVLSVDRKIILQDAMNNRSIAGTKDWTECDIVLDVPQHARYINIGAVLRGTGRIWVENLVVEEVGAEISTTDADSSVIKISDAPVNLDLALSRVEIIEDGFEASLPVGWRFWITGSAVYNVGTETNVFDGAAAFVMNSESELIPAEGELSNSSATLSQKFKASNFRGKRLRFSAWIKIQNVTDRAGLTLSCDGIMGDTLGFTNMYRSPITGTRDWNEYSVVIDIPREAHRIWVAAALNGNGTLWLSRFSIQEVDTDIPTTDQHSEPFNLDFSLQY